MEQDDLSTIQRCPHDRENPYAQISRALLRDKSISLECRGLLAYLLSMKNGWNINMKQLIKEMSQTCGKNQLYKIMAEAIEAGYIKREWSKGEKTTRLIYFLSESPKFKKCLRFPENGDTGNGDTGNGEAKEEASLEDLPKGKFKSIDLSACAEVANAPQSNPTEENSFEMELKTDSIAGRAYQYMQYGYVKILKDKYDYLIDRYGNDIVLYKIQQLNLHFISKPKELNKIVNHWAEVEKWVVRELKDQEKWKKTRESYSKTDKNRQGNSNASGSESVMKTQISPQGWIPKVDEKFAMEYREMEAKAYEEFVKAMEMGKKMKK